MWKYGLGVLAAGVILTGYALTVETLSFVVAIPGFPREARIWVFALGMILVGIGLALILGHIERTYGDPERSPRNG